MKDITCHTFSYDQNPLPADNFMKYITQYSIFNSDISNLLQIHHQTILITVEI